MSKYGWGWIWKSWFSPIGVFVRLFGYTPIEDKTTDPDEIKWRLTVVPVYGFGAKELIATANKMFGKYFDKDDIAESVKGFLEAKQSGNYYDIFEHFTLEVSPEERETILKGLGNSKAWKVANDEYKYALQTAEWQSNFYRERKSIASLIEDLNRSAEQDGYPTKDAAMAAAVERKKRGQSIHDDYDDDDGEEV